MDEERVEEDVMRVEFRPEGPPRRRSLKGLVGGLVVAGAILVAVGIMARLWPLVVGIFCVSAALAGLATLRTARRRRRIRERFGGETRPVTARTYLMYLGAWFVGLLAIVPVFLIGAMVAVVVVVVVGAIAVVLLVAALLRAD